VIRALSPGRSEVAYRLPSIVFMALAMVFIALLARRLIHPDAWWFAILACLTMRGINYESGQRAALCDGHVCRDGLALFPGPVVRYARGMERGSIPDSGRALWRVHLIFWPFYLVFALYALMRIKDPPLWQSRACLARWACC